MRQEVQKFFQFVQHLNELIWYSQLYPTVPCNSVCSFTNKTFELVLARPYHTAYTLFANLLIWRTSIIIHPLSPGYCKDWPSPTKCVCLLGQVEVIKRAETGNVTFAGSHKVKQEDLVFKDHPVQYLSFLNEPNSHSQVEKSQLKKKSSFYCGAWFR